MYISVCGSTCAKTVPAVHPRATTRRHDPIARHAQRRPTPAETARRPAGGVVEEPELRQWMFEVVLGSEMRGHSDLCRAQKHMRQPRARGAAGWGRVRGAGRGRVGETHLFEVAPAAPAPGTGGGGGPPPGVQGRASLPPLHAGEQARRQAHTVQLVRSRCGRARGPTLHLDPQDPYLFRKLAMRRYRKPPP